MKSMNPNIDILIVEDNDNMRKLMVTILHNLGFKKVKDAGNGKIAWDMLQENSCDLVISDLMMPEMDGLELLQKIRTSDEALKNTPVLMVTASDQKSDIMHASKLKIDGYIMKPINVKILLSKIIQITNLAERKKVG
jgi:two-component system chemotaxis response regulator CheY